MNIKLICIGSGILLLLAIPSGWWPYSYYQLLRLAIFVSSGVVAYNFYEKNLTGWTLVFGAICLLFNPVFPFFMDKSSWIVIDFGSALLFFYATSLKIKISTRT